MVSQAKMSPSGLSESDGKRKSHANPAGFAHDAIELGELQVRLLMTDLRAALKAARAGSIALLIAAALLFASAPVFLLALAAWLETSQDFSRAGSLGLTGLATVVVSGALLAVGWTIVTRGAAKLERSRQEFRQNMRWAKQMLSPKSGCDSPDR